VNLLNDENPPIQPLLDFLNKGKSINYQEQEEWQQLIAIFGDQIYSEILYVLTQKRYEPDKACKHWDNIIEHSKLLRHAIGRDVGLRVAICDYFVNIDPKLKDPIFVEAVLFMERERNAFQDELTNVYNRRYFNQVILKEIEFGKRYHQAFSLLIMDLDNFKGYNDANGHLAGDKALIELAQILKAEARAIDHVIRYGGEEFIVILPRSEKSEALIAAERYRRSVEEYKFSGEDSLPGGKLTVSIGVATFPYDATDITMLLQRADEALYHSKKMGRNRVMPILNSSEIEKRNCPRYLFRSELLFRLREVMKANYRRGVTQNISMSGLLCRTPEPLEIGQSLEVVLHSPERDNPIKFQAKSIRLQKDTFNENCYFLGLSFPFLPDKIKDELKYLIKTCLN